MTVCSSPLGLKRDLRGCFVLLPVAGVESHVRYSANSTCPSVPQEEMFPVSYEGNFGRFVE